ncbi:MAG: hypothetical protein M3256_21135 [Actinomycetota bacterium]|nr:hypothetical protein [Actinomycetota bacterium]
MTPRTAWLFAWCWLAVAIVMAATGQLGLAVVWVGLAAVSSWKAIRRGSRPWRRRPRSAVACRRVLTCKLAAGAALLSPSRGYPANRASSSTVTQVGSGWRDRVETLACHVGYRDAGREVPVDLGLLPDPPGRDRRCSGLLPGSLDSLVSVPPAITGVLYRWGDRRRRGKGADPLQEPAGLASLVLSSVWRNGALLHPAISFRVTQAVAELYDAVAESMLVSCPARCLLSHAPGSIVAGIVTVFLLKSLLCETSS